MINQKSLLSQYVYPICDNVEFPQLPKVVGHPKVDGIQRKEI